MGDIVDSGIGLSYRAAKLCSPPNYQIMARIVCHEVKKRHVLKPLDNSLLGLGRLSNSRKGTVKCRLRPITEGGLILRKDDMF
jgi:hypothetical protein